ncbi:hypothetical protein ARC23_05260 [Stenotrophomonas beteli]|uniref:Fimbrial protein n=2 Tax=Stenotrophomonas beteli TaxID=3384461 RepID=A0A0R0B5J0_9GAMM|nr:hypothetical protein ARC23_05260 [Stenotrophomonas maltophilia]
MLMAASSAVQAACAVGPQKWMPAPTGFYDAYSAGDVVTSWVRADIAYFVDCDPISSADLSLGTTTGLAGMHDGRFTFRTDHDGIGIQLEYRYIRAISGSGQPEYSAWIQPGTASNRFTAHAEYIKGNATASIPVQVDYRFIALRDFSGEPILLEDIEPLLAIDLSHGFSLNQLVVEGVRQRPREEASCEFSARPPATLELPATAMSSLKNKGDVGAAADFSFAWTCKAGNQGHSGRADFEFLSDAAIGATPGHLSTTGDAEGVDMLVAIQYPDGSYKPVVFGSGQWYANRLSPGTGGLPSTGRQNLQVRFIRNAAPLRPGTARSTMTINLVPF